MEASTANTRRRFASVFSLAQRAQATFSRFPFVVLSAIGAAVTAIYLAQIEFEPDVIAALYYPILMTCILGISLFLALRLWGESRGWSRTTQFKVALVGLAALVVYYAVLPFPIKGADVFRYFQLLVGSHLLVAFVPFIGRSAGENGFWQYNRVLFLRIALAVLYSAVLYIGLALAIAAVETLLDIDLNEMIYMQLWFTIVFVYGAWFFLAGIPKDVRALEAVHDYPTGLRIFTQYVLIPLVVVYLAILYAYMVKILVEWNLPKGWVGYPVIGVAITGMLALLLVYPIRERAENAWIRTYSKYFYWALFPLIGLISLAIATRIDAYGITERRYAVVIATAWLFGIALYFTFWRRRDIRIIPITLCITTLVTAIGPWSATSVSRKNQVQRLQETLVREEVLVDGALDRTPKTIEFEAEMEISNIVKYLHDAHGLNSIRAWYADAERLPDDLSVQLAMESMGLHYISPRRGTGERFYIEVDAPQQLSVAGFDYVYRLSEYWGESPHELTVQLDTLTELSLRGSTFSIGPPEDSIPRLEVDFREKLQEMRERQARGDHLGLDATVLVVENARHRLRVYLGTAAGSFDADSLHLTRLEAYVLVEAK